MAVLVLDGHVLLKKGKVNFVKNFDSERNFVHV